MRIGNLDDLEKSGHSDELANLIKSEESENLSAAEKWKNWWNYHKWYVICGIILLGIACDLIGNALGLWKKSPDFQIAYVGRTELPPDTVDALEKAFADWASDDTVKITVRINQYINGHQYVDTDTFYYDTATELSLIGDISDCESYFFLMDDPERFQREYQILAEPDGICPDDIDYSVENKTVLWSDIPALSEITDIVEDQTPGSRDILSKLYLGRRCFHNETRVKNIETCINIWNSIIDS